MYLQLCSILRVSEKSKYVILRSYPRFSVDFLNLLRSTLCQDSMNLLDYPYFLISQNVKVKSISVNLGRFKGKVQERTIFDFNETENKESLRNIREAQA